MTILKRVALWHISIEAVVGFVALAGVFYLVRGRFRLQHSLAMEQQFSKDLQAEAQKMETGVQKICGGIERRDRKPAGSVGLDGGRERGFFSAAERIK
jgi:hypothetical protein